MILNSLLVLTGNYTWPSIANHAGPTTNTSRQSIRIDAAPEDLARAVFKKPVKAPPTTRNTEPKPRSG